VSAFAAATIVTERLLLVPLRPEDADEMVDVLADPGLHQFIGGHPATLEELRARHATLTAGSPRLEEVWRNWIVRRRGHPWQHQGYASEAARRWTAAGNSGRPRSTAGRPSSSRSRRPSAGWSG
jgi:hypothetical protein